MRHGPDDSLAVTGQARHPAGPGLGGYRLEHD
jgi:hypothetical protein